MINLTNTDLRIGTEKNFGIVFGVFFLILLIYLKLSYDYYSLYLITISGLFFVISFTKPILLKYPNIIWFYFGILLGKIFVPIFLLFTYYVIFTPTGFLVKIFKRNYIDKNIDAKLSSYWIKRYNKIGSFDDQF